MKARLTTLRRLLSEAVALLDEMLGTVQDKPKPDNRPTSPEAIAVANLFARRLTTPWNAKEIKAFRDAVKRGALTIESMTIIAPYYEAQRARGEDGRHRHDLLTFLNNFDGELDRAVAFNRPKRPMTRPAQLLTETPPPEEEQERLRAKWRESMNGAKYEH